MINEIRQTTTSNALPSSERSPRQLIEAVIELLHQKDTAISDGEQLFSQLAESLDRYCEARESGALYEDAIERAPYLTADAERMKQQQSALRQSLQAFRMLASRSGISRQSLAQRFDEFAELYWEHDAAEHNFLQLAFPGPDWAEWF